MSLDAQPQIKENNYSKTCEDGENILGVNKLVGIEDTNLDSFGEKGDSINTDSIMETCLDGYKCKVCGK